MSNVHSGHADNKYIELSDMTVEQLQRLIANAKQSLSIVRFEYECFKDVLEAESNLNATIDMATSRLNELGAL